MSLAKDMSPVRDSEDKKIDVSISNGMKNIVENIISSYETRIQSIGSIFDTTHQLLEGFQDSFFDTKQEREKLNAELRENLAKNESLRRKDFNRMMEGVFSVQNERETEVKELLNKYINEQKEIAYSLRDNLVKVKDVLAQGEAERFKEFWGMIKKIFAGQEQRKEEVISKLKEFQQEQHQMAKRLRILLAKGKELRIKDLKSMLKEFKAQHKERMMRQEQRKKEVHSMLGEFKKERIETAKNWRIVQTKKA